MSVLTEYALWRAGLETAINDALNGPVKDGLEMEIRRQAQRRVYAAYSSKGPRRGQIGAESNLQATVSDMTLTIKNITVAQGGATSMSETDFVEQGDSSYHQPFARPFMDEAAMVYAAGQAHIDLQAAMQARGYPVY
jgi:hypothetical protein